MIIIGKYFFKGNVYFLLFRVKRSPAPKKGEDSEESAESEESEESMEGSADDSSEED